MIHPKYTVADVVTFSAMVNSTMDGAPVRVTIAVEASDEMERYVDRQSVGQLPMAMIETLRILGVIHDGSEPEVDVRRNF
ncbi:MAG: hypothetical protein QG549_646 [Patescibacteria group bacterium]|jgi:hypothetical protein|nr:hypothetical protein [Patescibacteria group bacterium]